MLVWDPLVVNEITHDCQRFLHTRDKDWLRTKFLKRLKHKDNFETAFVAGTIEWLRKEGIVDLDDIKPNVLPSKDLAIPDMYKHPSMGTALEELRSRALPEFSKYGVLIPYFLK